MTDVSELVRASLSSGSVVALPLAAVGGLATGLNPCCAVLYPGAAASCCATRSGRNSWGWGTGLAFVAGVVLVTTSLGIVAALVGRTMSGLGGWTRALIGLVPVVMGLHLLGWLRFRVPVLVRPSAGTGLGGAFAAGVLLSLVVAPCGTPVLASILSYAAADGSAAYGALLLFVYGLGAGVPVLAVGTAAAGLGTRLDRAGWRPWVDRITGVALIALGFYLLWTA